MKISLLDVFKKLNELKREGAKRIAVIGSSNWLEESMLLMDDDTTEYSFRQIDSADNQLDAILALKEDGFDAIIASRVPAALALENGMKARQIHTTERSILTAYEEAQFIASVIEEERARAIQIQFLLDNTEEGFILLADQDIIFSEPPRTKDIQRTKHHLCACRAISAIAGQACDDRG